MKSRTVKGAESPIVRRKLSDEVFERLRTMITTGEYRPGDTLPSERELMARYGVGRPAVREAMQALENLGLLAINHGERARVQEITAQAIIDRVAEVAQLALASNPELARQVVDANKVFSISVARLVADLAGDTDITDLESRLATLRAKTSDPKSFRRAQADLWTAIVDICGNSVLNAVAKTLTDWLTSVGDTNQGARTAAVEGYARLIQAIRNRDRDAAEAAMERLLDESSPKAKHAIQ